MPPALLFLLKIDIKFGGLLWIKFLNCSISMKNFIGTFREIILNGHFSNIFNL